MKAWQGDEYGKLLAAVAQGSAIFHLDILELLFRKEHAAQRGDRCIDDGLPPIDIDGMRLVVFHLDFNLHLAALTRKIRRLNLGAVQILADRDIDGQILLRFAFIIEIGGIHVPSDLISFLHRFYIAFDILNSV